MTIKSAVSAVFIYNDQVFLIQRQPYLAAFPGYHAFPGGKVDHDDSEEPFAEGHLLANGGTKLVRALIREMKEELHFDLEAAVDEGLVTGFGPLAVATAPVFNPIRFRNQFFRVDVSGLPDFIVDEQEAGAWEWFTPASFLDRSRRGQLLVVPPVRFLFEALQEDLSCSYVAIDISYDPEKEVPLFETFHQLWILPVRSHTLPPADRTNVFVVGDTVIDPSPHDLDELARLENVLQRFQPKKIMLTHHHGDHHQHADELARRYNLPILLSQDTHRRIEGKNPAYFKDLEVRHISEGDVLTQWLGEDVHIYEVPGHDEGQLALAPESLSWFIVGDLIQGIGTVVIAAPEGNMKKYFASLERVIALAPRYIIPSHGIAMGGTYRLEATLDHRREREKQIRVLWEKEKTPSEILEVVYKGLNYGLAPLAMASINCHLEKLREEGQI